MRSSASASATPWNTAILLPGMVSAGAVGIVERYARRPMMACSPRLASGSQRKNSANGLLRAEDESFGNRCSLRPVARGPAASRGRALEVLRLLLFAIVTADCAVEGNIV